MWLVFLLILFLIGIFFSCVEFNLYSIEVTEKKDDFNVIIFLKFLYFIKFEIIKIDRFGLKILHDDFVNRIKAKNINKNILKIIKELNVKIEKCSFMLKIGLLDMGLTNVGIVFFSSIFPILISKRKIRKKCHYKILPIYNDFIIDFKGNICVSIKLINVIKYYFKNINPKNTHNKIKSYDVKESY